MINEVTHMSFEQITLNLPDSLIEKFETFYEKGNFVSINAAVTELIRLGLLANEMIVQPNLNQNAFTIPQVNALTIPEHYKPSKLLNNQKFLAHLSENTIDKINAFAHQNKLDSRNITVSVLLRFGMQYYHELAKKPSFDTAKQLVKTDKTLVLSNDGKLFEELEEFQKETGVRQRTLLVRYLLNLGFEYTKNQTQETED